MKRLLTQYRTEPKINYATPNLVLLDVNMPGIDGFETFRRLKEHEAAHDVPNIRKLPKHYLEA